MKQLTNDDIRAYSRYPENFDYFPETGQGTIIDILNDERIPAPYRRTLALDLGSLSERLMRLFAVWCARQVVRPDADPRIIFALELIESYAENYDPLDRPHTRQMWEVKRCAARYAAEDAAEAAACAATYCASARYAAESVAWCAKEKSEAWWAAESASRCAADSAAEDAAISAQIAKLKEMILEGVKTGDVK